MKKYLSTFLLLFIMSVISACGTQDNDLTRANRSFFEAFDTQITVSIWYDSNDQQNINDIFKEISDLLTHIHSISTRFEAIEGVNNIHYINENPGEAIEVDSDLIDMLKLSISSYQDYPEKFNIALGSVLDIWTEYYYLCHDDNICEVPSTEELESAALFADPNLIEIDEDLSTVKIPEGMMLDLGGVAKGYGAELIGDYLRSVGINTFLVNAGASNVEVNGVNPSPDRDYWSVGLRDPDDPMNPYGRIAMNSGLNAVTSGDYERYYEVDGEVFHHLIDPDTFFPAKYTRTVTVVTENPALGDIISTIAFLLPIEASIDFINSIDGVEAIWLDYNREIHYSQNMKEFYIIEVFANEA